MVGLLVESAAAEVTRALGDHLVARERTLLGSYLVEIRKRGTNAVVAMDGRTTVATAREARCRIAEHPDTDQLVG